MKRAILFLTAGGILATVTLCVAAASPGSDASEIDRLKQQVEALTRRVEALEKRLNEQTLALLRGRTMPPMAVEPNNLPGFRPSPKDWRRFEFNGRPFYVIPIESGNVSRPEPGK